MPTELGANMGGFALDAFGAVPYGSELDAAANGGGGIGDGPVELIIEPLPGYDYYGMRRVDYVAFWFLPHKPVTNRRFYLLMSNGLYELVFHEQTKFEPAYRRGSWFEPASDESDGDFLVLRRTGGWLSAIQHLLVVATDLAGNRVTGQSR